MLPEIKLSDKIIVSQKKIHKGVLFSALHKGGTVAIGDNYSIKVTGLGGMFINIDVIQHSINSKSHTHIAYVPKAKKAPKAKPKPTFKFTKSNEVEEL